MTLNHGIPQTGRDIHDSRVHEWLMKATKRYTMQIAIGDSATEEKESGPAE